MPLEKYIIEGLSRNDSTFKELSLKVTDSDIAVLCQALKGNTNLTKLNIQKPWHTDIISDEGVKALARITTLVSLHLCCTIGDEGAKALARNTTLRDLEIHFSSIGLEGARALARNTTLTTLRGFSISEEGAITLAENNKLKTLVLHGPGGRSGLRDSAAKALARNTTLTELDLQGHAIGDEGAKALAGNKTLQKLNLDRNYLISAEGAKALARNTTLTELRLVCDDEGAKAFAENKTLEMLYFNAHKISDEGAKALARNDALTTLYIVNNQIGDEGAKAFIENKTLTTLYLKTNKISNVVEQQVDDHIKKNQQVTQVLITASKTLNLKQVEQLLSQGIKPYGFYIQEQLAPSNRKGSLLHLAVRLRSKALLDLLLTYGGKVEQAIVNEDGLTYQQLAQQLHFSLSSTTPNSNLYATTAAAQTTLPTANVQKNNNATPQTNNKNYGEPQSNNNNATQGQWTPHPFSIIPSADLQKEEKIGSGTYGTVYKATWRGTTVALKELRLQTSDESIKRNFNNEAQLLANLNHDHIIAYRGIVQDPRSLVMEFAEGGSLFTLLYSSVSLSREEQLRFAFEISLAIAYLHQCNPEVIHCDLKSANVLLDKNKKVKLSDFGLSKTKTSSSSQSHGGPRGTPTHMAPELLNSDNNNSTLTKLTSKIDIYSFAIILWELITRQIPFEGKNAFQIMFFVCSGNRLAEPINIDHTYKTLIRSCWAQNPNDRPTAKQVVEILKSQVEEASQAYNSNVPFTSNGYMSMGSRK